MVPRGRLRDRSYRIGRRFVWCAMFPILSSISSGEGLPSPSDIHQILLNALPQGGLLLEGLRRQEVHFQVQDFLQVVPEFKELQPNGRRTRTRMSTSLTEDCSPRA
jgi:hypothetical protein